MQAGSLPRVNNPWYGRVRPRMWLRCSGSHPEAGDAWRQAEYPLHPSTVPKTVAGNLQAASPARPKTGKDIAPFLRKIIPPRPPDQARPRHPASAPQHLAIAAEPRLRIFLVGINNETGIWQEIGSHPFPDVADHLPAPMLAVSGRIGVHRGTTERGGVQPRSFRCARRGKLPFGLGRQPPARPAAIRVGLVPVHVNDRLLQRERPQPIIKSMEPCPVVLMNPVHRMSSALPLAP